MCQISEPNEQRPAESKELASCFSVNGWGELWGAVEPRKHCEVYPLVPKVLGAKFRRKSREGLLNLKDLPVCVSVSRVGRALGCVEARKRCEAYLLIPQVLDAKFRRVNWQGLAQSKGLASCVSAEPSRATLKMSPV